MVRVGGDETGIYRSRPYDHDDLVAAGLHVIPRAGPLQVADAPAGASFAVMPPTGADAALYLHLEGRLPGITITAVDDGALAPLREAPASGVLDRLATGVRP